MNGQLSQYDVKDGFDYLCDCVIVSVFSDACSPDSDYISVCNDV